MDSYPKFPYPEIEYEYFQREQIPSSATEAYKIWIREQTWKNEYPLIKEYEVLCLLLD